MARTAQKRICRTLRRRIEPAAIRTEILRLGIRKNVQQMRVEIDSAERRKIEKR